MQVPSPRAQGRPSLPTPSAGGADRVATRRHLGGLLAEWLMMTFYSAAGPIGGANLWTMSPAVGRRSQAERSAGGR